SSTYKTSYEAEKYFSDNRNAIINKLAYDKLNEAIASVNSKANYEFGFPSTKEALYLWLVDNKKHPEHDAMEAKWTELKPILNGVTENNFSADDRANVMDMIKYFDELKTKYNKDEKGDKKIRYAAYYNNALLYILLDNPEKAMKEADGLIANDYDAKDGKRLKETAEVLRDLMEKNNIFKRHFNPSSRPYGAKYE
ncbi:MAG: hypothetical protein HYZ42_01565, partial [Bacteroidetes bacterium]|nr:hypothetical protein [Bacteroidota bacterium]